MLRLLTNEVDKMQEQVSNVNRGRMPLMALVDWTQLRKQSLSKKIYQQNPRKLKTKEKKTEQRISKDCRTTKGIRYVQLEYQKEKKGREEIFETTIENFHHINIRHQTKDPKSSENTK